MPPARPASGAAAPPQSGSSRRRKKPPSRKWLFLLPALIVSLSVVLVPVIVTTLLAFTDWNGFSLPKWVGLANFTDLMPEPRFWAAFRNNCVYTLLFATLPMICSLFAATDADDDPQGTDRSSRSSISCRSPSPR